MIDKTKFATGMGLLAGAFSRTLDDAVSRAYYLVLSPVLSTEEFEQAVTLVLKSETYWPSPAMLLSRVKADDTSRAMLAFEHVNRVMGAAGGARFLPHEKYQEFDAPTKAAISACGGLLEIQNTSAERWPALQRKFAAAYTESLNPTPRLAAAPVDGRVKQLVSSTARNLTISGRDRAVGPDA